MSTLSLSTILGTGSVDTIPKNVVEQLIKNKSAFQGSGDAAAVNKMTATYEYLKGVNSNGITSKSLSNTKDSRPIYLDLIAQLAKKKALAPTQPSIAQPSVGNASQQGVMKSGQQASNEQQSTFVSPAAYKLKATKNIFGRQFPAINQVIKRPQNISGISMQGAQKKIGTQFFNPIIKNTLPNVFAPAKKSYVQKQGLMNYMDVARNNMTQKQDKQLKSLQTQGLVKWDDSVSKYFFTNPNLQRIQKQGTYQNYINNINTSNVVLSQNLTQTEFETYVPSLVKDIVTANADYSKAGIGPISTKSLPFYAGRFIDPATGRIRILPKASTKYLNPFSYKAKLSYLQARVLNKWNQYIDSQSQYLRFSNIRDPNQWQKKQKAATIKRLSNVQGNFQSALKWFRKQYTLFMAKFPVSPSSQIVLGNMDMIKLDQLGVILAQSNNASTAQKIKLIQTLVTAQGQANLKKIKISTPPLPNQIQQFNKVLNAYAAWAQKGQIKTYNLAKKMLKGSIPPTLTQQDIQKVQKTLQIGQSAIARIGAVSTQADLKKIFQNPTTTLDQMKKQVDLIGATFSKSGSNKFSAAFTSRLPPKTKIIAKQTKKYGANPQFQVQKIKF